MLPFLIQSECKKAAWQHGYRIEKGETDAWLAFDSTTAQGTLWLTAESEKGPWFLALNHAGVIQELALPCCDHAGPGLVRYAFPDLTSLYVLLPRIYQLSVSLPDAPLNDFHLKTAKLPATTEAERLVIQRIGQDIFRASLMDYWQGRCPLTNISDPALLRASHIIPWAECESDAQRLDVHNGLLLSALWDAAFDRHLLSFDNEGKPIFSPALSPAARDCLIWSATIPLTPQHQKNLEIHRANLVMG